MILIMTMLDMEKLFTKLATDNIGHITSRHVLFYMCELRRESEWP